MLIEILSLKKNCSDAAWESEPNAYEDLLSRTLLCVAENCLCENGREFEDNNDYETIYCTLCGSTCVHVRCWSQSTFTCETCRLSMTNQINNLQIEENNVPISPCSETIIEVNYSDDELEIKPSSSRNVVLIDENASDNDKTVCMKRCNSDDSIGPTVKRIRRQRNGLSTSSSSSNDSDFESITLKMKRNKTNLQNSDDKKRKETSLFKFYGFDVNDDNDLTDNGE